MNFSKKFKSFWWCISLILFTLIVVAIYLCKTHYTNVDLVLFLFWLILLIFPIISEISIFGINVKKDIENAVQDLKSTMLDVKNQITFQPTINNIITPASSDTINDKIEEEIKEEQHAIASSSSDKKPHKLKIRMEKIFKIESKIHEIYSSKYADNFQPQIQIKNQNGLIVADGVILENDKIKNIIEIKYITEKSISNFYYIASRIADKIFKISKSNITFIIVMDKISRQEIKNLQKQIEKLNFTYRNLNFPHITIEFYQYLESSNKLIKLP